MALGPNLIFGRPPVILPVKPHPCARTQPPAPFRKTVSVKLRFARPYWNKPVISRSIQTSTVSVVGVVQWRIVVKDGRIVEVMEVVGVEGSRVLFERYLPLHDTVLKRYRVATK